MSKLHLSPPWVIYYKKLDAFFEKDDDVTVVYDEIGAEVKLYVSNPYKADALTSLLPEEKEYGNVALKVTVIPSNINSTYYNADCLNSTIDLYKKAFINNPIVDYIKTVKSGLYSIGATYVVFNKQVVQYYTDDIGTINGFSSTLYENIARDIFENNEGVFFCTNTEKIISNSYTCCEF